MYADGKHFSIDEEDFEQAKNEGLFEGLKLDEEGKELEEKEEVKGEAEVPTTNNANLNNLILKRMNNLMNQARVRNPLQGRKHEKRVKDIREGKFKICVPAVTLTFKYLVKMFKIIKETMEDAIKNKEKSSFKKFMIYASKFSLIQEVLFSAFHAKDDDILYKDLASPEWEKFFEVYDFYESKDLKKFMKQYNTLCDFLGKILFLNSS